MAKIAKSSWRGTALLVGVAGIAAGALWVLQDYRKWLALGPGGLPSNFKGWLKTTAMRLQKTDPLSTDRFQPYIGVAGDSVSLDFLPERSKPRPSIAVHPVPHRQLDQFVSDEMKSRVKELFDDVVTRRSHILHFQQSYLEKRHQAVFLLQPDAGHPDSEKSHGEVAHIHPSDSSMHMILSPSDATTVIRAGWGERHPLAGRQLPGTGLVLPEAYIFIYPPRDPSELEITARILEASVNHMAMVEGARQLPVS